MYSLICIDLDWEWKTLLNKKLRTFLSWCFLDKLNLSEAILWGENALAPWLLVDSFSFSFNGNDTVLLPFCFHQPLTINRVPPPVLLIFFTKIIWREAIMVDIIFHCLRLQLWHSFHFSSLQLKALGAEGMIRELIQYLQVAENLFCRNKTYLGTPIYNAVLHSLVEAKEVSTSHTHCVII
jgi:hypothetical protein